MTNIKNFDLSLLSIDQVLFKKSANCVFYEIKYFKNLDSSNSLYLVFNNVDAYIEESGENKYLIFASTDKNGKALENYTELWNKIKEQIELISGNKVIKYEKDFMKIKFESNDDLPLGKILNILVCIIIVRSVFKKDGKYYPQVLLHECLHEYEKQMNIKNRTYYFYKDLINIKNFDLKLLKLVKKSYKSIDIYYIGYIKKT